MNKLVSRNPIQRFQQGKKIVKAQFGLPTALLSRTQVKKNGSFGNGRKDGKWVAGKFIPNTSNNIQQNKQQSSKDYSFMKGTPKPRTPEEQKKWEAEVQRQKNLMQNDARKAVSTTNTVQKNTFKPKTVSPRFIKGYNDEGLQAEIGGTQNIKTWQQRLKDFYAPGTYTDDGLWGKNTQAAYEKYLLAQNIQPQAPTIPETPITPTYKYTPTNYYALNNNYSLADYQFNQFMQNFARKYNLNQYLKKGGLISKSPVERFRVVKAQKGISFKQAFNDARSKKQRYFNWTDAKGNTRMYNSKSAGNDTEYESFIDNMNEMSALLPTDTQPKHLGWDRNNPTSSELRGKDRQIKKQGTESTLPEIFIQGQKKVNPKIFNRIKIGNTIYSRGIAQNFPGINTNKTGLFTKGNKIFKRDLVNGKYVETPVGVIHKGQQYYDESIYGRNKFNQFSTSTDNDNVVTYDEYRNRLSGASRNKFMGYEAIKGQNIPSELPLTQDMRGKYNVQWFKNYKF